MGFQRGKDGKVRRYGGGAPQKRWKVGDPIEIQFGPIKCKILTPYPKKLDQVLTAPVPGYFFMPQFKAGNWDGKHHFITQAHYFPTGLLPLVYAILKTGKNPLDDDSVVLRQTPSKVIIRVPEGGGEYFNPNFIRHYLDKPNLLENLTEEEGTFSVPRISLVKLKKVKGKNPLAAVLLEMFKCNRIKGLSK